MPLPRSATTPASGFSLSSSSSSSLMYFVLPFLTLLLAPANAYDSLDPNGNITIKWDVMSWTGDGYVASVTIYNYQEYRHIDAPGWILGWVWPRKEIIWSMVGAQATLQGDCSKFHAATPHCCMRNPTVVDLLPGVPYNMQYQNCCRGGVLTSWVQDPSTAAASFQITVGLSGNTNKTVKLPLNFTLQTPGPGYSCGPAKTTKPTLFVTSDGRRKTQALMTWSLICSYSQVIAHRAPPCCVSFSSFYNDTIVPCPTCACGCENKNTCYEEAPLQSVVSSATSLTPHVIVPQIHCTMDMCPIRLHWHVKQNYQAYWRVKLTITNRNYAQNYSQWNTVIQHPNFDNLTEVFSFTYTPLNPFGDFANNTAMFWGIKYYNDLLMQAGKEGNVQSEFLFEKDKNTFSFNEGWAFPKKVYFNGDLCVLPPPDAYPSLPNGVGAVKVETSFVIMFSMVVAAVLCVFG